MTIGLNTINNARIFFLTKIGYYIFTFGQAYEPKHALTSGKIKKKYKI